MTEITRVLRVAAWRLFVVDLLARLAVTATAALVGLIALRFADAVWAWTFSWTVAFAIAAGAAALSAVVWSVAVRVRGIGVARTLDERADLRESLSTALCVASSNDPWSQAVVETARDKARRVVVRDAIPITAPRLAPMPLAAAIALVIAWFSIPSEFTWTTRHAAKEKAAQVEQVKADIQANKKELTDALKKANIDLTDLAKPDADAAKPEADPEAFRRQEVKRLTEVTNKLNQIKDGDKAQQLKAAREAMSKLKQPGPGPLDELSKQMARGNFEQAKKELDELTKKLSDSSAMSQDQKQALEQQLSKMSEQLAKLAEDRKALEKKLEEAGLSKEQAKQAAADPEALKKALEQAKNLTEDQKKQLSDEAKACNSACKNAGAMSEAMAKMAKAMNGKAGMGQEGMEGMEALEGQLSELEMLDADMQSLEAAMKMTAKQMAGMGQCEGNMPGNKSGQLALSSKQGKWREGDSGNFGQGSGGPGKGAGGNPETTEADFKSESVKAGVKKQNGPIIGQTMVAGDQIRGDSTAEFAAIVEASESAATESIGNNLVAPEFQPAVKSYFGRLKRRVEAANGTAPAPPPAPASDAKDADSK
jgi:hypothetical protein